MCVYQTFDVRLSVYTGVFISQAAQAELHVGANGGGVPVSFHPLTLTESVHTTAPLLVWITVHECLTAELLSSRNRIFYTDKKNNKILYSPAAVTSTVTTGLRTAASFSLMLFCLSGK